MVEKEMIMNVKVDFEYPISLTKFMKKFPEGSFKKPEVPCEYIIIVPNCEGIKLIVTENSGKLLVKPSRWERIKEDFMQFLDDIEWEKCKKEDLQIDELKRDFKKAKRWLLK